MSLQDMNDKRLVRELITAACVSMEPHMWGLSEAQARAELAEAQAEVLRRMRTSSAQEQTASAVTEDVPKRAVA